MFKKIFGSSVKIDTKLYNSSLQQGDILQGEVYIKAEKDIEVRYIDLILHISFKIDDTYSDMKLHTHRLDDRFYLHKGQDVIIPFEFQIPIDIPTSSRYTKLYIKTDAETSAEGIFEKKDKDYIELHPHQTLLNIFQVLEQQGFRLSEVEFETIRNHYGHHGHHGHQITTNRRNYLQEFDFKPTFGSNSRGNIDEFEVSIIDTDEYANILIQFSIEKKARKLMDFVYNPDNIYRIEVAPNQSMDYYENIVYQFLNRY